jgi:hypothetical protein
LDLKNNGDRIMALRIRRGTEAQRTGVTLEMGEVVWTTDYRQLWVGDGLLPGGYPVVGANVAGYGLSYNATSHKLEVAGLTTDDIAQGSNNKYFSNELAQDATATLFNNGSHTGITFQYDDTGAAINAVVTSEVTQDNVWSMFRDGTHSNITFNYIDNGNNAGVINATVTLDGVGIVNVQADTNPSLGGNLNLNSRNITGNGNISTTGNITATGALSITGTGLFTSTLTSNTSVSAPIVTATSLVTDAVLVPDTSAGLQIQTKKESSFSVNYYNGTSTSKTAITAGDSVGAISVKGWNGSSYEFAGALFATWEAGAVTTDNAPKSTVTIASGKGGADNQFASLDSNGIWLSPISKTTVYNAFSGNPIPSATTMGAGARAFVSDAQSSSFGFAYSSGGTFRVPVYSDGSAWYIG